MYFPINNIWCLIWNIIEFTTFSFGIDIPWLFGKCVGSKGKKQEKPKWITKYLK